MGWFDSMYDLIGDGFGSLPSKKYGEAEKILKEKVELEEVGGIIKRFGGIEGIVYKDCSLSGFRHKDITEGPERIEYLGLLNDLKSELEVPFSYFVADTSFKYFLGSTFKQFCEFANYVSRKKNSKLLNDPRDYEFIVHPLLDELLFIYGVDSPLEQFDLGGIDINGKICYLPDSSSKEFVDILNIRLKKLPEHAQAYFSELPKGGHSNWREAIKKSKFDFDSFGGAA